MSLNDRDWTPLMLEHFDRDTMCLVHNDVRRRLGDALAENQRLREKIFDYDNQFSRMSQALDGDATDSPDKTFAGFVIDLFEALEFELEALKGGG